MHAKDIKLGELKQIIDNLKQKAEPCAILEHMTQKTIQQT